MEKKTVLLICNSNMFVPVTMTEVLSHPENQYIVISDTDNIQQFFQFLSMQNVKYYHYGFNPQQEGRFSFIKKKKDLLKYVSQFNICKVVFFHAEFGGMANWLLEKLSKRIPIQYCKLYDSIPAPKAPLSSKSLKLKISERLYWGQKMDILEGVSTLFPSLPESFFRKVRAQINKMPVDNLLISSFLSNKLREFNIKGKYVLLTGTTVHDGWYSEEIYTSFINELIEVLGQENVVSKCHPRYHELFGKECNLTQIPSYIPGNVLIDSFDYYIGLDSTLLVEAARAGKIAISYIDWLHPDEQKCKVLHAFFENRLQGKGKIFFPTSMEEFKKILN